MLFGGGIWWALSLAAAVWVIVDVLNNRKSMDQTHKIIWIVCGILFGVLAAIVYYFVVYNKK